MVLDKPLQAGIDVELPVVVKLGNKKGDVIPAADFAAAEFRLYSYPKTLELTKTLGDGIVVEDVDGASLFIIMLSDEDTMSLDGLYEVELTATDISGNLSMPLFDSITFKPRLGV